MNPFNAAEVKQCAERALGMMCKATRQFKPIIAPETVSYDYITDTLIANGVNKMRMRDDLTLGGATSIFALLFAIIRFGYSGRII